MGRTQLHPSYACCLPTPTVTIWVTEQLNLNIRELLAGIGLHLLRIPPPFLAAKFCRSARIHAAEGSRVTQRPLAADEVWYNMCQGAW